MQHTNETSRKTLGSVVGQKVLGMLENTPGMKIIAFIGVAYALAWPESAAALAKSALSANEYFLAKMIAAGFLIRYFYPICDRVKKLVRKILKLIKLDKNKGNTQIEGVPVSEILHQLFYCGHFKREEVIKKWAIPQGRFDAIAKKLESLNILVRGENNSRILNPEFTREQVAEILQDSGGSVRNLKKPLRILICGEPTKPSAEEIKVRISDPSPSPPPLPISAINLRNA